MINIARIALIPVIALATGIVYARGPAKVLSVVRFGMFLLLVFVAILVLTGLLVSPSAGMHSVMGHGFVIVLWVLAPAITGVSVSEIIRSRRWLRLVDILAVQFLLVSGIVAAVTGYLIEAEASVEARLRFTVLHKIAFPFLVVVLVLTWLILSRNYARPAHIKALQPTNGA